MTTQIKTSGGTEIIFQSKMTPCREDSTMRHGLLQHLKVEHEMGADDYQRRYGSRAPMFGAEVMDAFYSEVKRKGNKSYHNYLEIGDIKMRAQSGQMAHCPTRPNGYKYPVEGKAGLAAERVARAFKYGRSIYLYGPAGTGKSDMFRALCHDLNKEYSLYPMREDLDTALYMGQMQVVIDERTGTNKTEYIPGRLLHDIQGRVGLDGVRRPVCIVFDDLDRGPAECQELLRHILDGAQEVFIPELGKSIPVFPGTQIVATANSRGAGDDFGTYASVQTMDSSILDRFGRFVEYDYLQPKEEINILRNKFPYVDKQCRYAFSDIQQVTETIRSMISSKEIYIGFSHRILTEWCESLVELVQENRGIYRSELLRKAAQDWLERFDEDVREELISRALTMLVA